MTVFFEVHCISLTISQTTIIQDLEEGGIYLNSLFNSWSKRMIEYDYDELVLINEVAHENELRPLCLLLVVTV